MNPASRLEGDSLPFSVEQHLDAICLRFEKAWQAGQQSPIEQYLVGVPAQAHSALLRELLAVELAYRLQAGERPTLTDYQPRFPDQETLLEEVFARFREQMSELLKPLIAQTLSCPGPSPLHQGVLPPGSNPIDTIAGYEIIEELGRGGMGIVYKARQIGLDRLVALKMILAGTYAGAEERARFRAEAEAVARLQHPNIVQIHDIGEHDGLPYFSLEFCGGGSLAAMLNATPLPPRDAAQLVETLARAMQAAHERGIIHRDLKPANVLLQIADWQEESAIANQESGKSAILNLQSAIPKITDFGLAKRVEGGLGLTQTGAILGTPSYMAPEQAGGKTKEIGPLADVYALGAILYELLTGRPPFKAASHLDTMLLVVSEEPVSPARLNPLVPRDLETICLKCLQKEPHLRYRSAEFLADDLHRFWEGEPVLARPVSRWERGMKWVRRHPALAAVYGLVLVVAIMALGGGGIAWLWNREARARKELEKAAAAATKR